MLLVKTVRPPPLPRWVAMTPAIDRLRTASMTTDLLTPSLGRQLVHLRQTIAWRVYTSANGERDLVDYLVLRAVAPDRWSAACW